MPCIITFVDSTSPILAAAPSFFFKRVCIYFDNFHSTVAWATQRACCDWSGHDAKQRSCNKAQPRNINTITWIGAVWDGNYMMAPHCTQRKHILLLALRPKRAKTAKTTANTAGVAGGLPVGQSPTTGGPHANLISSVPAREPAAGVVGNHLPR